MSSTESNPGNVQIYLSADLCDYAEREGITSIEEVPGAMLQIARLTKTVGEAEGLPSQVLVMRDIKDRSYNNWDVGGEPAIYSDDFERGLFIDAKDLHKEVRKTPNADRLRRIAREIGAASLTGIAMPGWDPKAQAQYPVRYAEGLLMRQRPLDLKVPPLLGAAGKAAAAAKRNHDAEQSGLKALRDNVRPLGLRTPFRITRQAK